MKTSEDVLAHFGILGMKWGVRRKRGSDGKIITSEYIQSRKLKKTPVSKMSNAELKQYVERMNLEQQYKNLKNKDVTRGRAFAQEVVKEVGKEIIKEAVKSGIKSAIKK